MRQEGENNRLHRYILAPPHTNAGVPGEVS
jgi:hypothetical protein